MKSLFNWAKTNKTTIFGSLAAIWTAFSAYAISKKWLDVETSIFITSILTALGVISSKDDNKHSTAEQVQKATRKKLKSVLVWEYDPGYTSLNDVVVTIGGQQIGATISNLSNATQGQFYPYAGHIRNDNLNVTPDNIQIQPAGGGQTYIAVPIKRPK